MKAYQEKIAWQANREYKAAENNLKCNRVKMVFTRKDGTYSGKDIVKYPFRIIHHELGIKCRFYNLRGSFATISLRNGCDIKNIAEVLGNNRIKQHRNIIFLVQGIIKRSNRHN